MGPSRRRGTLGPLIIRNTMAKQKKVKTECQACDGTGLYQGFCEAKDEAVICIYCVGTGCDTLYYKPFVKRKGRRGIKKVSWSRGGFIATGVGSVGDTISYREFAKGKLPENPKVK